MRNSRVGNGSAGIPVLEAGQAGRICDRSGRLAGEDRGRYKNA